MVKVKCTLVQALRLCTGRTAHRGSRGIALPFLTTALEGVEGSASRRDRSLPPGKDPLPIAQEAVSAPGPVWTGAQNLAPHRDSIPGPSNPWPVAIQTELSGPRKAAICEKNSTPVYSIDFDVTTAATHSYLTYPYTTDNHRTHSHSK
jgi:hypothetical protein